MDDGGLLVVIPCLNERWTLPSVLDSLLADGESLDALFVVADGGSTDGTREWVQEQLGRNPRLRLYDNARRIQSSGVNGAVAAFGGRRKWVIRIDAHADYPRKYLSKLVCAAGSSKAQSVVVSLTTYGAGCFQRAAAAAQNSMLGTGGARHRRDGRSGWVEHGHHALFDLQWFRRLGGYDEAFAANEDAEYDHRLRQAGGRIWLANDCPVIYYPRETPQGLYRQYERNGSGRAQTMLLHARWPRLRQIAPILVAPLVVFALATPWIRFSAAPLLIWIAGCTGYGLVLGVRARRRCEGMAGVPAMIMHLAWSIGFWGKVARAGWRSVYPPRDQKAPIVQSMDEGDKDACARVERISVLQSRPLIREHLS